MQIIKITTKRNQTSSKSIKKEALQAKYKKFKYLIDRPINNITAAMTIYGSGYCNVIGCKRSENTFSFGLFRRHKNSSR